MTQPNTVANSLSVLTGSGRHWQPLIGSLPRGGMGTPAPFYPTYSAVSRLITINSILCVPVARRLYALRHFVEGLFRIRVLSARPRLQPPLRQNIAPGGLVGRSWLSLTPGPPLGAERGEP